MPGWLVCIAGGTIFPTQACSPSRYPVHTFAGRVICSLQGSMWRLQEDLRLHKGCRPQPGPQRP